MQEDNKGSKSCEECMSFMCSSSVVKIEGTHRIMVEVQVHCKDCGTRLLFDGVPPGYSAEHPTVSIDNATVCLPAFREGTKPSHLDTLVASVATQH